MISTPKSNPPAANSLSGVGGNYARVGGEIRTEKSILAMADKLIRKHEPGYNSDDDIADAAEVTQCPGTPSDSESENGGGKKSRTGVKKSGRGDFLQNQEKLRADIRLTSALDQKTPIAITLKRRNVIVTLFFIWGICVFVYNVRRVVLFIVIVIITSGWGPYDNIPRFAQ